MKIFISYPPLKGAGCPTLGQNRQFQWFSNPSYIYPMVPASAATLLKSEGHDVVWDDCIAEKRTEDQFWRRLKSIRPRLIAMETKTPVVQQHWQITKKIKALLPDTFVVLMGDHVTALPEETMESCPCDYVIAGGDYDFSLQSIVKNIESSYQLIPGIWYRQNGEIRHSGLCDHSKNNLDDLPWIDRKLTRWQLYGEKLYKRNPFTYIMAGRDCPYGKCTFCSWTTLYPRFRVRSPENVVEELAFLVNDFGVREVFDDTGTFPTGGWLEKFCENMIRKGLNRRVLFSCNFRYDYLTLKRARMMKKAGFRLMKMGLESANQKTLDHLKKNTTVSDIEKGCKAAKDAGLEVHLTMMVGYPWESRQDIERTVKLARKLMETGMASMLQSTVIIPYPGTPLFAEAIKRDWFQVDPNDYGQLDMSQPVLKTPDMATWQVKAMCKKNYTSFFSIGYLLNQLRCIRRWEDIRYYLRGLLPVLGHLRDFSREEKN